MTGPRFEGTINLGHVLMILSMLAGGAAAWSTLEKQNAVLSARVTALELSGADLTTTLREVQRTQADTRVTLAEIGAWLERGRQ